MTSNYCFYVNHDDVEGRKVYPLNKVLSEKYTDLSNGSEICENVWVGVCLDDFQPHKYQVLYYENRHGDYKYIGHVDSDDRLILGQGASYHNRVPWYIIEAFGMTGAELPSQEFIRIDVWAEDMDKLWRYPSKYMKRSTIKAFRERYMAKVNELTKEELGRLFPDCSGFKVIGSAGEVTGIRIVG